MLYVKLVCKEWKYNLRRGHWNFVLIIVKDFKPIPAEWCLVLCIWLPIDFFTEVFYVATYIFTFSHFTFVYMYPECTCDFCGSGHPLMTCNHSKSCPFNPGVAISSGAIIDIGIYFVYIEDIG